VLDHVSLNVRDLAASRRFYEGALRPLGYSVAFAEDGHVGFTDGRRYDLFLHVRGEPSAPVHVAFRAADRATVDEFHRAALAAGGEDNGAPGARPQYHAGYYGAFALDPDGNNVEAVCHREPE
jgi:catechol 2,3-dioxygenase-like lactoylglutathione lyase family enzyme